MNVKFAFSLGALIFSFSAIASSKEDEALLQEKKFDNIYAVCQRVEPAIDDMFSHFSQVAKNAKLPIREFSSFEKTSFGGYNTETESEFKVFVGNYMKNIYFSISEGKEAFTTVGEDDLNNSKALFKKLSFSDCVVKLSDQLIPGVDYKKWLDSKKSK